MNRSDFLIRQLRYYYSANFQGRILIGDSSNKKYVERTRRALSEFRCRLNIDYGEYPYLNDAECLRKLIDKVVTTYAVFVADDDFLVPSALGECVEFLDNHPGYSSAHGKALGVALKFGKVIGARNYELPVIEDETASERIRHHLSNYSVSLFSVHRTETWRRMYQYVPYLRDKTFSSELFPCCLSIISGKTKELDCLYLVRQDHDGRYLLPAKSDWVSTPNWFREYLTFEICLAYELQIKDNIGTFEARRVVEEAVDVYMTRLLGKDWGNIKPVTHSNLRKLGRIPASRWVWRKLHPFKWKADFEFDFEPIKRALEG